MSVPTGSEGHDAERRKRFGDVQAAYAATLVDEWVRAGIEHAVVCPGSRSTPLALALAAHRDVTVHVRLDERSAAFVALGLGLDSGMPAVLLTTSGTAAAELHPAMVEADLGGTPLLACTADRPPELHEVGAPQTIDQNRLFGSSVRWFFEPGVADEATAHTWRSIASRAVAEARSGPAGPGPVHLNLAFRDPLLPSTSIPPSALPGRAGGAPWHRAEVSRPPAPATVVAELADAGRRGVILAGAGCGEPEAICALSRSLGWPVLADPRSGARVDAPGMVAAADGILRSREFTARFVPQVVLRLGAPWVSKVVNEWVAALSRSGSPQFVVDPWWRWLDPERGATTVVRGDPAELCRAVVDHVGQRDLDSTWSAGWQAAEAAAQSALTAALEAGPIGSSDPGALTESALTESALTESALTESALTESALTESALTESALTESALTESALTESALTESALTESALTESALTESALTRRLYRAVPSEANLVVSSSMPVRDVEAFAPPRSSPPRVLANRGANGIDGVVSTALGVALGRGRPTVALVGDLAFLHDCSALVGSPGADMPCTIVVADNGGGGIFSFLPPASALDPSTFENLFGTPQASDIAAVAGGFGLPVADVDDVDAAVAAVERGVASGGLSVVRVRLPGREENVAGHRRLNESIVLAVDAAIGAGP